LNVLKGISNRKAIKICCISLFNVVVNVEEFLHFFYVFVLSKYLKTNANSAKKDEKVSIKGGKTSHQHTKNSSHLEIRLEFF
jgi:hypothetical protein